MDWFEWTILIVTVLAAAGTVAAYCMKKISKDKAISLLITVTRYVRKAEKLIDGEGRGDEKKAYVLGYLKELFAGVKNELLSKLIDLVVAILNTMGWW